MSQDAKRSVAATKLAKLVLLLTAATVLMLGSLTAQQTEVWRDNVGFYYQEMKACALWTGNPCQSSHNNLGLELMNSKLYSQAIQVIQNPNPKTPNPETLNPKP